MTRLRARSAGAHYLRPASPRRDRRELLEIALFPVAIVLVIVLVVAGGPPPA